MSCSCLPLTPDGCASLEDVCPLLLYWESWHSGFLCSTRGTRLPATAAHVPTYPK